MEERKVSIWVQRSHEGAQALREELEAQGKEVRVVHRRRNKLSPSLLWEEACDYFRSVDENPLYKNEMIRGGDRAGEVIQIEAPRPYTWTGLDEHLFRKGIMGSTVRIRHGRHEQSREFEPVVEAIETVMRRNKFDGAAVGIFNPVIIARDLGLMEKTQSESVNINLEQKLDYSELSTEALEEITALMAKQKRLE